jgi:hypothetical protein
MDRRKTLLLLSSLAAALFSTVLLSGAIADRSSRAAAVYALVLACSLSVWVKNRHALPRRSFATALTSVAVLLSLAVLGGLTSSKQGDRVLWSKDPKVSVIKARDNTSANLVFLREIVIKVSIERDEVFTPLSQSDISKLQKIADTKPVVDLAVGAAQENTANSARLLLDADKERTVLQDAWDPRRESVWRTFTDEASSLILRAESLIEQSQ